MKIDWGIAMIIVLLLVSVALSLRLGAMPALPHAAGWVYGPSGMLGLLLVVVLVRLLLRRI